MENFELPKEDKKEVKKEDPLIQLFKSNPSILELIGRVWELLYIEGDSPDIGKRRENFIRELLKEEFSLQVNSAPSTERGWDFSIKFGEEERKYNLKTTEKVSTVKVAWNGFPSENRVQKFEFKSPILYITGNREEKTISIYVFELNDLEDLKKEMGSSMWWIPANKTNPRGFGIKTEAVRRLMEKAKKKGNFITYKYKPININSVKEKYWKNWYSMLKRLASEI
jgi:hypothetical protein